MLSARHTLQRDWALRNGPHHGALARVCVAERAEGPCAAATGQTGVRGGYAMPRARALCWRVCTRRTPTQCRAIRARTIEDCHSQVTAQPARPVETRAHVAALRLGAMIRVLVAAAAGVATLAVASVARGNPRNRGPRPRRQRRRRAHPANAGEVTTFTARRNSRRSTRDAASEDVTGPDDSADENLWAAQTRAPTPDVERLLNEIAPCLSCEPKSDLDNPTQAADALLAEVEDDAECTFCLERLRNPAENKSLRRTPCGHYFHAWCLEAWVYHRASLSLRPANLSLTSDGRVLGNTPMPTCPNCAGPLAVISDADIHAMMLQVIASALSLSNHHAAAELLGSGVIRNHVNRSDHDDSDSDDTVSIAQVSEEESDTALSSNATQGISVETNEPSSHIHADSAYPLTRRRAHPGTADLYAQEIGAWSTAPVIHRVLLPQTTLYRDLSVPVSPHAIADAATPPMQEERTQLPSPSRSVAFATCITGVA